MLAPFASRWVGPTRLDQLSHVSLPHGLKPGVFKMRQRHRPSETDLIAQKQEVDRLRKLIREAQLSAEKVQRKPPRKSL